MSDFITWRTLMTWEQEALVARELGWTEIVGIGDAEEGVVMATTPDGKLSWLPQFMTDVRLALALTDAEPSWEWRLDEFGEVVDASLSAPRSGVSKARSRIARATFLPIIRAKTKPARRRCASAICAPEGC